MVDSVSSIVDVVSLEGIPLTFESDVLLFRTVELVSEKNAANMIIFK